MLDPLEKELYTMIAETCRATELPSEDPSPDAPLFGPDSVLGLDSLDAVEVVVAIQRTYDIRIGAQDTSRQVLRSLRTLAEFVRNRQTAPAIQPDPATA